MGLGLPDGGHLTHGYYVRAFTTCLLPSLFANFSITSGRVINCIRDHVLGDSGDDVRRARIIARS